MDTAEKPNKHYCYIILIPHRDVLIEMEKYRQRLFSLGFHGAYSFPLCAPLASISKTFCREELKELAKKIRMKSMGNDGKIFTGGSLQYKSGMNGISNELSFFGPGLNLNIDEIQFSSKDKLSSVFSPPLICAALVKDETKTEQMPVLSFRAACLANLTIGPLDGTDLSFEWKISSPVWLPSFKTHLHF